MARYMYQAEFAVNGKEKVQEGEIEESSFSRATFAIKLEISNSFSVSQNSVSVISLIET